MLLIHNCELTFLRIRYSSVDEGGGDDKRSNANCVGIGVEHGEGSG